uniref:Uncharacterized protein n=1 Tax=Rhizochromulina marina TaxID=1034831 RepID=A0A7S2RB91_9STRA|mmetsp:Transcript_13813/g.40444  ORF Transcript_13813/g.40444 Transcript_13813/m.40444 type:complete len:559 (+) Transcript_13813:103-1779(+)
MSALGMTMDEKEPVPGQSAQQVTLTCESDGKTVNGLAWSRNGMTLSLGMPIREAVAQIQSVRPPKRLDIRYSDGPADMDTDVAVEVAQEGLRLRFEAVSQRLRIIEVFDLAKLPLTHRDIGFAGPVHRPSFTLLYRLFGPTHPGRLLEGSGSEVYLVEFPSVAFEFDGAAYPDITTCFDATDKPASAAGACRMFIYHGSQGLDGAALPPPPPHYMEPVELRILPTARGKKLCVGDGSAPATPEEEGGGIEQRRDLMETWCPGLCFPRRRAEISLGATTQDVMDVLGPPADVFHVEDDCFSSAVDGSYFYNFFDQGLDFLFSGSTHRLTKIVVHSNLPGRPDFLQYARCNFRLPLPGQPGKAGSRVEADCGPGKDDASPAPAPAPAPASSGSSGSGSGKKKKKKNKETSPIPPPASTQPTVVEPPPVAPSSPDASFANGSSPDDHSTIAGVHTPWLVIHGALRASSSSSTTGSPEPAPAAIGSGHGQHPFGTSLIYSVEPAAEALFDVTKHGLVDSITLYSSGETFSSLPPSGHQGALASSSGGADAAVAAEGGGGGPN